MIDNMLFGQTCGSIKERPELAVLSLVYRGAEKGVLTAAFGTFLLCFSFFIDPLASSLHGPWLDQAFSEVLTERYGKAVTAQNVRLVCWSDIRFSRLEVSSPEGRLLLRASHGSIRLENPRFWETKMFETRIQLHRVVFFREYYKNSAHFKPWGRLLHKPIHLRELVLKVVQSEKTTWLKIVKSDSNDVRVDGGLFVNPEGRVHDGLHVSFSPWMMLRAIF